MARARSDMTPSLLGSTLLHGGLLAATLVAWPWLSKPVRMEASVPVTIVSEAPVANVRPAEQAPVEDLAATEAPVPEATPEPASPPAPKPEPTPTPTPPAPKAKPTPPPPAPKPAVKPTPKKPQPAPAKQPTLDLDSLAKSLKPSRPAKPKSSAAKGPARAETAAQARLAVGQANALAASALSTLSADLSRRWNPNCEVEGGSDVDVRVAFRLGAAGQIVGAVESTADRSGDAVVRAAADRAKRAVHQAAPFDNLPDELYGERIVVRFNARQACATG